MKRIATLLLVVLAITFVLNACKSSEHCPAYSSTDATTTTQNA